MDEAQARGWPLFYEGKICRFGHQAPYYVANPNLCVDCKRLKAGKQRIGPQTGGTPIERTPREYVKGENYGERWNQAAAAPQVVEPDRSEKKFLEHYAAVRDLNGAAALAGMTAAQIHARLSYSKVFRDATNELEKNLMIPVTVPDPVEYQWDDDRRVRLITVYIDTGDMAIARDAIRVTASEYYRELARNAQFARAIDEAKPLATNTLEEKAQSLSLAGNDKLLALVLRAERPEKYSERVKMDLNVTEKLTDDQINARLARFLAREDIIDAEYTISATETPALAVDGRERAALEAEQNGADVSGDRKVSAEELREALGIL